MTDTRTARGRHSRETRGKFGGGGGNYIIQLPGVEGEDWYSVKRPQKNEIDIIEFKITQDWYPRLKCRTGGTCGDLGLKPGELDYKLEIPVHQSVGRSKRDHVCPYEAFGDPCPECEHKFALLEANNNKWDQATMLPLNPSWRCFYNTFDYSENRFRPWHAAYNTWEKQMQDALDRHKEESGVELFPWAYDAGMGMEFYATEESLGGGKTYNKPQMPTFFERDPYTMEDVEKMWSFDKYVKFSDYDEISKDFYGSEEVTTSATGYRDQQPDEQPTTRTRSRNRPSVTEQSDDSPTTRGRTRTARQPVQDDAPFDTNQCSYGHAYGKDVNRTTDCPTCTEDEFKKCLAMAPYDTKEKEPDPEPQATARTRGRSRPDQSDQPAQQTTRRRRG
jgi:hypothetical protein